MTELVFFSIYIDYKYYDLLVIICTGGIIMKNIFSKIIYIKKSIVKRRPVHINRLCLVLTLVFLVTSVSSFSSFSQGEIYTMDIPYISQLYPVRAVVGCEPTSVLMALRYKGAAQNIGLKDFLSNMPKSDTNPAKGFVGSPYQPTEILRNTIYPNALADYANTYQEGIARDISGSELEDIKSELLADNPVVIYATMWWKKPYYKMYDIEGEKQWLLRNNHVVVLAGYDDTEKKFYILDPYNKSNVNKPYTYWMSEEKLKPIYDERKWAIALGKEPAHNLLKAPEIATVMNQTFEGYRYQDVLYLNAKTVLENTIGAQLYTDIIQKTAQLKSNDGAFQINFNNNSVYKGKDNVKILDLKTEEIFIETDVYMIVEDINSLIELLK